jgi:hypothetical protein
LREDIKKKCVGDIDGYRRLVVGKGKMGGMNMGRVEVSWMRNSYRKYQYYDRLSKESAKLKRQKERWRMQMKMGNIKHIM